MHERHLDDPLEVLRRLGGREIAAIAGAIFAARLQRIPVVLDGYTSAPAAACCRPRPARTRPLRGRPCVGRGRASGGLRRIGKAPLLDLGMRLGEGSGAALAVGILKAALACHSGMATFAEAGVADKA